MIRVMITDDHEVIRVGIKGVLENCPEIKVTGEAGSGEELLSWIQQENYDVILLDISLSGRSGLDILSQVKNMQPHLPVLIFSIHLEENFAMRALKAGASGYLHKRAGADEIIKAVRMVYAGEKYISQSLAGKLADTVLLGFSEEPHDTLSNREYEVFLLLAQGISIKEIGEKLALSPKTITTYRARIMEKMGFETNADMTRYVLENKLLEQLI